MKLNQIVDGVTLNILKKPKKLKLPIIISLLLLSNTLLAQKHYFDLADITMISSEGDFVTQVINRSGSFNFLKNESQVIFNTEFTSDTLKVLEMKSSEENSLILKCEREYQFIIFEKFVIIRKSFYVDGKFSLLIEERLFSFERKI